MVAIQTAMGQEIQKTTADKTVLSNTEIDLFVTRGAVTSTTNVIKAKKKNATPKQTRDTLITVLEETTYDEITPTDAEMFINDATTDAVKDVLKSCSGNATECYAKAEECVKDTATGGNTMDANQLKTKVDKFQNKIAETEMSDLNEACLDEGVSEAACTSTKKNALATILGKDAADIKDDDLKLAEMKGSQTKTVNTMEACRKDATKSVDDCISEAEAAFKKSEGRENDADVDLAEFHASLGKGLDSAITARVSACRLAADGDAARLEACRNEDAFKNDLQVVDASGSIPKSDVLKTETSMVQTAAAEEAAATKNLADADKKPEFRKNMEEGIGETMVEGMKEDKYLNNAANSAVAQRAAACVAAGVTECDTTTVHQEIKMASTDGGRRRLTASDTTKIKSRGAQALITERGKVCYKLHKDSTADQMTECVSDKVKADKGTSMLKATFGILSKEKNRNRYEKVARSKIGAETVMTCYKAGLTDGADDAAKTALRTTCKAEGKAVIDKFVLDGTTGTTLETISEAMNRQGKG